MEHKDILLVSCLHMSIAAIFLLTADANLQLDYSYIHSL